MKSVQIGMAFMFLLGSISVRSQVIEAPTIICVTTSETDGDVTINWTPPPVNPCGPFVGYVIFGATSITGPYVFMDTVFNPNTTSLLHFGANGTLLDWYYFMTTVQDCPGATFDSSAIVEEEVLVTPELNYVTVTPGGIEVHWYPSPSLRAGGYIVYYSFSGGLATEVDTVIGRNSIFYLDSEANANTGSVAYTIAAFDACGNPPSLFNEFGHNTIFLRAVDVDPCNSNITLSWNEYKNWPNGVDQYQLEIQIDEDPPVIEETFPIYSPSFIYTLDELAGDTICMRIQAVRDDGVISSSNSICIPIDFIRSTSFNYLRNLTVSASDEIAIEWYIDTVADISSFRINRGVDNLNLLPMDSFSVTNLTFLTAYADNSALPQETSYYYQVESIDACNFSLGSTLGRTIHLSGDADAGTNNLSWNAFELEYAVPLDYTLYRLANNNLAPMATLPETELEYEDFVATEISDDGTFCYFVEASYELNLPGLPGESLTSRSNVLCLDVPPVVYVPNSFVPGGVNNFFRPVLLNPNVAEYDFKIFDRWGKIIFETGLTNIGWDGSRKGEALPMGGYVYYIRVVSNAGIELQKEGVVVLVR